MNSEEIAIVVNDVNRYIRQQLWFDFEIISYGQGELVVGGGKSLSVPHELKLHFIDVCLLSTPTEWRTDTSRSVLTVLEGDAARSINATFQVEQGYMLFRFAPEDYPDEFGCLIGAKGLSATY